VITAAVGGKQRNLGLGEGKENFSPKKKYTDGALGGDTQRNTGKKGGEGGLAFSDQIKKPFLGPWYTNRGTRGVRGREKGEGKVENINRQGGGLVDKKKQKKGHLPWAMDRTFKKGREKKYAPAYQKGKGVVFDADPEQSQAAPGIYHFSGPEETARSGKKKKTTKAGPAKGASEKRGKWGKREVRPSRQDKLARKGKRKKKKGLRGTNI